MGQRRSSKRERTMPKSPKVKKVLNSAKITQPSKPGIKNKKKDQGRVISTYVRHPSDLPWPIPIKKLRHLPNGYVTELDLPPETIGSVGVPSMQFQKKKSPLAGLEAFVGSDEAKIYPPLDVLYWLAQAFKQYIKAEGGLSLEKLLGFQGRGKRTLFRRQAERGRDCLLCTRMFILNSCFGLSIEEAASLVANHQEEFTLSGHPRRTKLKRLSEETIRQRFVRDREWKAYRARNKEILELRSWSLQNRSAFLKQFPIDSLPNKVKHYVM